MPEAWAPKQTAIHGPALEASGMVPRGLN
jgi:hypothetical protein